MNEQERAFHDSFKPSWGPGSILMYSKPSQLGQPVSKSTQTGAVVLRETGTLSSDGEEIALAKLVAPQDVSRFYHLLVIALQLIYPTAYTQFLT